MDEFKERWLLRGCEPRITFHPICDLPFDPLLHSHPIFSLFDMQRMQVRSEYSANDSLLYLHFSEPCQVYK